MLALGCATGFALWLYWATAAPGLTWAHFGADGGDFLAAARSNGVPHPTGYPLYLLLLQSWLAVGDWLRAQGIGPMFDPAGWGNRLSALAGAGAAALTTLTAADLLKEAAHRWVWATLAALAWTVAPLPWSQALITEVYAVHALLVALLGYAALRGLPPWAFGLVLGLTATHHLTAILLWPAACYWWIGTRGRPLRRGEWLHLVGWVLLVVGVGYGGLVVRMLRAPLPPPVAWGYPDNGTGLWWLVSGAAYRDYLFDLTWRAWLGRLAAAIQLLATQYTPIGLALCFLGAAIWDQRRPRLRIGALLWALPVGLYATAYGTVDSHIYLLPVVWLMSLLLAEGLAGLSAWAVARHAHAPKLVMGLAAAGLLLLLVVRLPQLNLRQDHAARDFLADAATLPSGALVVSTGDAETFTLWYGAWGGGGLAAQDLVVINSALYQFGWYRRLMHDIYPQVAQIGAEWPDFIQANQGMRPIFYVEPPPADAGRFVRAGRFWQRLP
jgi:hypothetical protein